MRDLGRQIPPDVLRGLGDPVDVLGDHLEVPLAGFRQRHAAPGLRHQRRAEMDLQGGDLLADGGGRDAQFLSRPRNAPGPGRGVENSDGAQRQVHRILLHAQRPPPQAQLLEWLRSPAGATAAKLSALPRPFHTAGQGGPPCASPAGASPEAPPSRPGRRRGPPARLRPAAAAAARGGAERRRRERRDPRRPGPGPGRAAARERRRLRQGPARLRRRPARAGHHPRPRPAPGLGPVLLRLPAVGRSGRRPAHGASLALAHRQAERRPWPVRDRRRHLAGARLRPLGDERHPRRDRLDRRGPAALGRDGERGLAGPGAAAARGAAGQRGGLHAQPRRPLRRRARRRRPGGGGGAAGAGAGAGRLPGGRGGRERHRRQRHEPPRELHVRLAAAARAGGPGGRRHRQGHLGRAGRG